MTAPKPNLARAIPMGIIGFVLAVFFVVGVRALQSMEPVWDTGVVLVVAPFFVTFAFIWGIGGLDSRLNQHPHQPEGGLPTALTVGDEEHHDTEEAKPFAILSAELWKVATALIVLLLVIFTLAMLPTGLTLRVVNQDVANTAAFEPLTSFDLPLGLGTFEGSQLAVFLGIIGFTLFSLFAFAGGIGLLMYALNRQLASVKNIKPQQQDLTPPLPVRVMGRLAGGLARTLRKLPAFFGQK